MISQPASPVRFILLLAMSLVMMSACSTQKVQTDSRPSPVISGGSQPAQKDFGQRAAEVAIGQVGVPYRYGGSTPSGFDCSGLVHYSYAQIGKSVPRTTGQLWEGVARVDRKDIRTGDVLFFRISGKMSHVGLYLGEDRFVHAPSSGKTVSIQSLRSDYYKNALIGVGRLQ